MYSVPTKKNAKKLAPHRSPAAFAPLSVRSRKIDSGNTGAWTRRSTTTNATSSAADAASTPIVLVAPQPYCGACEIAYTSATSPPVPTIAPTASNRRCAVSSRLFGTMRGASASAAVPIGTFR